MEYYPVTYKLSDGSIINVHIKDTCGQEKYKSIWKQYYKEADGILLVFDISNKDSFDDIKNYYVETIKEKCKTGIPIILLGNKTDLEDERQVSQEEAIALSIEEEYIYKETSCVNNVNVADAFETIIEMWNINSKKNNATPTPIKRSKSKENMEEELNNNYRNYRNGSFALSERNYSSKKKSLNDDEENENENIKLKNNKKKKKKSFC